jgi:hypothetical protein
MYDDDAILADALITNQTQAVSDIPCVLFVDELLTAYPSAKVIITSRPVERWLLSVENSFYAILSWKRWPILELLDRVPACPWTT